MAESGSLCAAEVGLKFTLFPQPTKYLCQQYVPPCLAYVLLFGKEYLFIFDNCILLLQDYKYNTNVEGTF